MKRVGLVSDSHGYFDEQLRRELGECDEIWHAGDFGDLRVIEQLSEIAPLKGVFGNIDGAEVRALFPEQLDFECEGVRVRMLHIGNSRAALAALKRSPPDVLICGHSHIVKVDRRNGCLHINPGACGRQGIHLVRTAMRLELAEGAVRKLQLLELGPR